MKRIKLTEYGNKVIFKVLPILLLCAVVSTIISLGLVFTANYLTDVESPLILKVCGYLLYSSLLAGIIVVVVKMFTLVKD